MDWGCPVIAAINHVLEKSGLDKVRKATLQVQRTEAADQQQVQSRISSFGGEGWLCLTDKVIILPADNEKIVGKIVLSGELANGSKSLHIRQSASGWELHEMISIPDGDQLMLEEEFLSIQDKDMKLKYETCWRRDENGTLAPFASRFAGFFTQGGND